MNPDEKKIIDEENIDVDITEYENLFFEPTDEEQDLETEIALAIDSLMND